MKTLRIPLQYDARRRIAVASTAPDVVRMQIIDILVTSHTERPFRPTYGAGLPEMVLGTYPESLYRIRENEVLQLLKSLVKGGTVVSVSISDSERENGAVNVDVQFTLIRGGELYSAQQTFTGLVTEESFFNYE